MSSKPIERLRDLIPATLPEGDDRGALQRRLIAAAICLVVAAALWFTVSMRETYTVSIESPLDVVALPEGQALRSPLPEHVRVQYQGVGWELLSLSRTPPELPLYADEEDVDLLSAATESARTPPGVSVIGVSPQHLALDLDAAVTRRLPIRIDGTLELASGYGFLTPPPPYARLGHGDGCALGAPRPPGLADRTARRDESPATALALARS